MFGLFLAQAFSKYQEITDADVDQYIGGEKPIFVKFFSPNCGHCAAMAEDFASAAALYGEDFTFGAVDCTAQHKTCEAHSITGYPTVRLFLPNDKKGIEFDGERNEDSFCDFVEEHAGVKAKRPPKLIKDFNPYNIEKAENGKCTFITFFAPYCGHCKRFIPTARKLAGAFEFEPDVSIGLLNCVKFHEVCENHSINGYPTIRLYQEGKMTEFDRSRDEYSVAEFLNEHCGTHRGPDGLLSDDQGIVAGAYELCQKYIAATAEEEKTQLKAQIAALPGTEFYQKVIARIEAKGLASLEADMKQMRTLLDGKKGSQKSLDGMKQRYNVFTEFEKLPSEADINAMPEGSDKSRLLQKLKRVATPTPEPVPEPTPVPEEEKPKEL